HELDKPRDQLLGENLLFDNGHVRTHDEPSVEGRDRRLQVERLDEHLHTAGGTSAGYGEQDPGPAQTPHGFQGPFGENLLLRHERAIDIREHQTDRPVRPGPRRRYGLGHGEVRSSAAAASARMTDRLASTRPAGIERSPARSLSSASRLSSPVTSQTIPAARARPGYVSVIRRCPWYGLVTA